MIERLEPVFVELFPERIEPGKLYVSMAFGTAAHLCCCGCSRKVITPFGPTDWKLTYDGEAVSLHPSIGNWNFPCQSHYWIRENKVSWARRWSSDEIEAGRARDKDAKDTYFGKDVPKGRAPPRDVSGAVTGFWKRILRRH